MRRFLLVLAPLAVLMLGCGLGGSVMKNYTMKKAREVHATGNLPCDAKNLTSTIVQVLKPFPKMVDYLAVVSVAGCGKEKRYKCGNFLCSEARKQELGLPNYCNEYLCEAAP